jgi:hypothetical protein
MHIDGQTNIIRSTAPVETTVGAEVVLMTLDSGECLGLGETGSDVWRLLENPISLDGLVESLGALYEAPAGVIQSDVIELLNDMQTRGLVEFVAPVAELATN